MLALALAVTLLPSMKDTTIQIWLGFLHVRQHIGRRIRVLVHYSTPASDYYFFHSHSQSFLRCKEIAILRQLSDGQWNELTNLAFDDVTTSYLHDNWLLSPRGTIIYFTLEIFVTTTKEDWSVLHWFLLFSIKRLELNYQRYQRISGPKVSSKHNQSQNWMLSWNISGNKNAFQ